MLAQVFLGMSLIGAEWVLYFLLFLSLVSVTLIIERIRFYQVASKGLGEFRAKLRGAFAQGSGADALKQATLFAEQRATQCQKNCPDLDAEMALTLLKNGSASAEILNELAQDCVLRGRLHWEKNLALLATIGSNSVFIGLFGTVLGIIKAFHDLAQRAGAAAQTVTAGVSEALVATAIGLLVAIPAVIAYNIFQRRVKTATIEAEALKSFLVAKLSK